MDRQPVEIPAIFSEDRYHKTKTGRYLGDLVYGANDGIITTFAIVAGAAGANLSPAVIIILGLSNIVADGLSMASSNFLAKKSERDFAKRQREKETWEIKNLRTKEVDEIREIYKNKGFEGKDLDRVVEVITSDEKVWLDTMMLEELGIIEDERDDPKKHGVATFFAFLIAGFVPLLPFLIPNLSGAFTISIFSAGLTLFAVGALRSFVTSVSFIKGGLEMFLVGSVSAGAAYMIGSVVEGLIK